MSNFEGYKVFITGASRGIGAATARYFVGQGAQVALFARNKAALAALVEELGERAVAFSGSVARYQDMEAAFTGAVESFGRVDALINNAGTIDPIARLADSDPEAWDQVIDINLKGVYHGLRVAIPSMLQTGGGVVVNLSSGAAGGALEGWSHYCSSKAAVLSLTRCAHKEYADQGIRVVGLSPGTVVSDMQDSIRKSGINPVSQLDASVHISPEWVARAIGFLCTAGGAEFAGGDFSLKTDQGRARVGLPALKS